MSSDNELYQIGISDSSSERKGLVYCIVDEYGTPQTENLTMKVDGTGRVTTTELTLPANSTYYVGIINNESAPKDFNLDIKTCARPEQPDQPDLVFEKPFELNETQVRFVINEATLLDEASATEALAPIADVILKHPDHQILLAGTTATDGSQESCVDLSNRRANTVKNLLINTFNVPESQLLTVGLGYEADPFERGKDRDANGNFVTT